jgi:hypothetical protein
MHLKKVILAALAALMLLALAAGTASALRSIESSASVITLLSRSLTFTGNGIRVVCEVGITITLNERSIAKRPTNPIGRAEVKVLGQEGGVERCSTNRARTLGGPFNINYLSFTGTLPRIEALNLQLLQVAFSVTAVGITCLYTANALGIQKVDANRALERLRGEERGEAYRLESITAARENSGLCPTTAQIALAGSFAPVTPLVTITLV